MTFTTVGAPMEQRQMIQQPLRKEIIVQPDQPDIIVNVPKQDNTVLWVGMVIVPVILAVLGWWFKAKLQIYGNRRARKK